MAKRPNVLFIMADQFNAGNLMKDDQARTPNLDQLAEDGVLFQDAYCNNPVCAPSRVSFITGQYPRTHRVLGNNIYELDDTNPDTMPCAFRKKGYQTALVGKSHMIGKWDRDGFEHIRYCDLCDCDRNDPLQNHYYRYLYDLGLADKAEANTKKDDHPGAHSRAFISEIPYEHSLETWTANESIKFLKARDHERPFFLHMSFLRPHPPRSVPIDLGLLYDPEKITLPENAADYFVNKFKGKHETIRKNAEQFSIDPRIPKDENDLKRYMAYYLTVVTMIDEQIGRVIDYLKAINDYENTVIVFTADHGEFAGEHGVTNKNAGIYESIHRIPFILKYPGCAKGKSRGGIVESVDLFPTMSELCSVDYSSEVDGISVLPVAEGVSEGKEFSVCEWDFYHKYKKRITAIRTKDYRLIYFGRELGGELYEAASDPGEMNNLYDEPGYETVKINLLELMLEHVREYSAKSSFKKDIETGYLTRNCLTTLIHKGKKVWSDIEDLYIR